MRKRSKKQLLTCAILATRLKSNVTKRRWKNFALNFVVGLRNAVEALEHLERLHAARRLVRNHAANGPIEDFAWRTLVKRATRRLDVAALAEKCHVLEHRAMEVAGDVNRFAAHDGDALAE